MIVTTGLLVAGISLGLVVRELRRAPEGYEDEHGFHVIRKAANGPRVTPVGHTHIGHHPRTRPATAH